MKRNTQRQNIINFIIKNNWYINWTDYKILWLDYIQALYNNLKWLEARGYITKVWKHRYSVIKDVYENDLVVWEITSELARLKKIERKYNAILLILES